MITPLYMLRIYSMKETLLTTYVANIFSMSPGLILQTMAYTLSVIQVVNFRTRKQNSFRTATTTNAGKLVVIKSNLIVIVVPFQEQ